MNYRIIGFIVLIILIVGGGWWYFFSQPAAAPTTNSESSIQTSTAPFVAPDETIPVPKIVTPAQSPITNNMHLVTIKTAVGDIAFETFDADAPKTVENFIALADKGFYNGVIFHRVIKGFMIQGGDPTGTGTGGPGYAFADELNPNTLSYKNGYKRGVVAMANAGPNTNGSQFFIMHADTPLPNNYTIFGQVVRGLDVVDKIATAPVAGDRPLSPVKMITVTAGDKK